MSTHSTSIHTSEDFILLVCGHTEHSVYSLWELTQYGDLYTETRDFQVVVGIIGFMLIKYGLSFQFILISYQLAAVCVLPHGNDIGVMIVFGLVRFYRFIAHIFNFTPQSPLIP